MSDVLAWPFKSPSEVKDYGVNWRKKLRAGEYILSSTWVTPEGITVQDYGLVEEAPTTTVIWLSGGFPGKSYKFLNRVGTSEGRLMEAAASIDVRSR